MKTPFITVLYLLVQATTLLAQGASDFILTKSGEQLAGEVFQPINQLREVHFKPIGSDKFQTYSAGDLKGYQFEQQFFTACNIPAEGGSVFLLTLVNGAANLYGLPNKNTYYVEKNGTFHRLERKDRMIEGKLMEDHRYAGILKSLFADCALPDKIYEQMKFSPKSLIDATQRYNTCRDPNLNYAEKRKKAALPVSFGVGGGVSSSKAYHANSFNPYSKNLGYTNSYHFVVEALFGLPVAPSFFVRPGLGLNKKYGGFYDSYSLEKVYNTIDITYLQFPIKASYILPSKTISPYLSIGLIGSLPLKKSEQIKIVRNSTGHIDSVEEVKLEHPIEVGGIGEVGIQWNRKGKLRPFLEYQFEKTRLFQAGRWSYNTHKVAIGIRF